MRFLLIWFNALAPSAIILIFPFALAYRIIFVELSYPCSESITNVLVWVLVFSIIPLYLISVLPKYEKLGIFKEVDSEDKNFKEVNKKIDNKEEEDYE